MKGRPPTVFLVENQVSRPEPPLGKGALPAYRLDSKQVGCVVFTPF